MLQGQYQSAPIIINEAVFNRSGRRGASSSQHAVFVIPPVLRSRPASSAQMDAQRFICAVVCSLDMTNRLGSSSLDSREDKVLHVSFSLFNPRPRGQVVSLLSFRWVADCTKSGASGSSNVLWMYPPALSWRDSLRAPHKYPLVYPLLLARCF